MRRAGFFKTSLLPPLARVGCFLFLSIIGTEGQEPKEDPANDAALLRLRDPDMTVRIEALRELQTSLDPRLPEALLPLLSDEGNSIRRLAARGVGSRYHQIPAHRVSAYLTALKPLSEDREAFFAIADMADRATGLLTRTFEGEMFAPSPDGKWVIYERYSLPCLIDIERNNEELLGWSADGAGGRYSTYWNNTDVPSAKPWEPGSRAVALDVSISRRSSTFWFWRVEGSALSKVDPVDVFKALGVDPDKVIHPAGFFVAPLGWKGDEFQFTANFTLAPAEPNGDYIDEEVVIGWDLETAKLRAIPEPDQISRKGN